MSGIPAHRESRSQRGILRPPDRGIPIYQTAGAYNGSDVLTRCLATGGKPCHYHAGRLSAYRRPEGWRRLPGQHDHGESSDGTLDQSISFSVRRNRAPVKGAEDTPIAITVGTQAIIEDATVQRKTVAFDFAATPIATDGAVYSFPPPGRLHLVVAGNAYPATLTFTTAIVAETGPTVDEP